MFNKTLQIMAKNLIMYQDLFSKSNLKFLRLNILKRLRKSLLRENIAFSYVQSHGFLEIFINLRIKKYGKIVRILIIMFLDQ